MKNSAKRMDLKTEDEHIVFKKQTRNCTLYIIL